MDIDAIMRHEDDYSKCFCTNFEDEKIIRFQDVLIADMYDHNYTRIKATNNANETKHLIMKEIELCVSEGKKFCNIYMNGNVELPFVNKFHIKPDETTYAIYATNSPSKLVLNKRKDCSVDKIINETMISERLTLELAEYGKNHGEDFCKRKSERMKENYFSEGGVYSYLCRTPHEVVGKCDLYVKNNVAKIEDFDVSSLYQRKGYGTTIVCKLVSDAIQMGAEIIYLVTDIGDTVKDMYTKLGFKEVAYKKQLFFQLP